MTPYRDGPLLVRGDVELLDERGEPVDTRGRATIALCRCGRSRIKPLCDGTHRIGSFSAPSRPERELRPAPAATSAPASKPQ